MVDAVELTTGTFYLSPGQYRFLQTLENPFKQCGVNIKLAINHFSVTMTTGDDTTNDSLTFQGIIYDYTEAQEIVFLPVHREYIL